MGQNHGLDMCVYSNMKKISIIFGTRPEAIKLCPLILALKQHPDEVDCRICVTGQHRQMLDQVLKVFGIEPDTDLDLMQPNQTLGNLTAHAIEKLDAYFADEKPDIAVVQGDTTTVLAGALAAFYHKIPVAHVEAGLRTGNMFSPYPEEANRVLTTRLARWHFCPTETSRQNLLKEGVPEELIHVTGNTVIDALHWALAHTKGKAINIPGLGDEFILSLERKKMVLITGHRRENFGDGFRHICQAIIELGRHFPDVEFVYPVHLNPNVQEPVNEIIGQACLRNVHLIPPLEYLPFLHLMSKAYLVLTDSGGVQEEAPSLGKPVLVMRDTTERPEAVTAGTVRLVGSDSCTIVAECSKLLTMPDVYQKMSNAINPYGDGKAVERIVHILLNE